MRNKLSIVCIVFISTLAADAASDAPVLSESTKKNQVKPLDESTPTIAKFLEPGIYTEVDLLIWHGYNRFLEFAATSSETATSVNVIRPNTRYNAGFRVGLGYKMPHASWDIYTRWSWFTDTAKNSISPSSGETLFPLLAISPSINDLNVDYAKQFWRVSLNQFDIGLGAPIVHLPALVNFRSYLGVKGVWIDQVNTVQYNGGDLSSLESPDVSIYKDRFWGLGLKAGITSYFWISEHFDFWGNLLMSTISGNFSTREIEKQGPNELVTADIADKYYGMIPVAELDVGFLFKYAFSSNTKLFSLGIAWSDAFFFEEWINTGALVFQGVTITTRLDF